MGAMTAGIDQEPDGQPLPSPNLETRAPEPPPDSAAASVHEASPTSVLDTAVAAEIPTEPVLPPKAAKARPPMRGGGGAAAPTSTGEAWYRSDQARFKSVHRRANPLWRRSTRGLIALSLACVAAFALFLGAREIQDYIERDKLPGPGVDDPNIRATSFEIRSTSPAPTLDGTLTIDSTSRAIEFAGRGTGDQAGLQIVSPDGSIFFVRTGVGDWRRSGSGDTEVADLKLASQYLVRSTTSDDVLHNRLRRGFVDLIDRADEGEGDSQLTRYEMEFDTLRFAENFPLQWSDYRSQAIPGIGESRAVPVTMWIDNNDVLVRVTDTQTGWAWERLIYSSQQFTPIAASADVLAAERASAEAAAEPAAAEAAAATEAAEESTG
jgi:hypothetical protein